MPQLSPRRASRRRTLLAAVLLPALLLAACGSEAADDVAGTDQEAGGEEAGAFPVSFEHEFGTTTLEERPERIVTVGLTDHDALLALGVAPVGVTEWFGEQPHATWPWATDALGGAEPEVLVNTDGINYEAIAALRPDAILGLYAGLTDEEYEKLSAIAPTVAHGDGYVDFGISWQELTTTVGKVVGRSDEAEELVAEVEAEFDGVREAHPEFTGATAVVATPYEGIYVYGAEDPRGRLLEALGFEIPQALTDAAGEAFGGNISQERASLLDLDVVVWLDEDDAEGPLGGPLYASLPVHTEGREVFLDSYEDPVGAATSFVSVLSLPFVLDELTPRLALALDGDPATAVPE